MADKTYKMTVELSNGTTVDAGTFVAPQGPQGPKGDTGPEGPAGQGGGIGDWQTATFDTVLEDGTYFILPLTSDLGAYYNPVLISIENGHSGLFIINNSADAPGGMFGQTYTAFDEHKIVKTLQTFVIMKGEGDVVTLVAMSSDISRMFTGYKYIKIK